MLDRVFALGNMTAMVGWAFLIFLPRWRGISRILARVVIPSLLSVAYLILIATYWSRAEGGFGTLDGVRALLGSRPILLAGWFHYLAFDLFVGSWVVAEGQSRGIPHLVLVPILLLTFMFGPIGYLTFVAVAAAWRIGGGGGPAWLFEKLDGREPRMIAAALLMFGSAVVIGVAALVDDRMFLGTNVWFKPLKFAVSTGIYLATLAWFWPYASRSFHEGRGGRFVVWGSIVTGLGEVAYIAWRASRAEASHFNFANPAGSIAYAIMGIAAVILSGTALVLAFGVGRKDARPLPPGYRLGVVLGLVLSFTLSTSSGLFMGAGAGHGVGIVPANDHPLPFVGWSSAVGDYRVAHFFGMHSLQVVPIVGAIASTYFPRRGRSTVVAFASLHALMTLILFFQAKAGLPTPAARFFGTGWPAVASPIDVGSPTPVLSTSQT